jgi:hypothetical protein
LTKFIDHRHVKVETAPHMLRCHVRIPVLHFASKPGFSDTRREIRRTGEELTLGFNTGGRAGNGTKIDYGHPRYSLTYVNSRGWV